MPGLLAVGLISGLVGCMAPPPVVMPPVVDLSGLPCGDRLDLITATSLPPKTERPVVMAVPGSAACWRGPDGHRALYAAFQLPDFAVPSLVRVSSVPAGHALMVPRILLLDPSGAPLRTIGYEHFQRHDQSLVAAVRVRPNERYLIVASDQAAVGQVDNHVVDRVVAQEISNGRGSATFMSGATGLASFTFSHNGQVAIETEPVPVAN